MSEQDEAAALSAILDAIESADTVAGAEEFEENPPFTKRPEDMEDFPVRLRRLRAGGLVPLLRQAREEATREALERGMKDIRAACGACEGSGYADDGPEGSECEYCGRPRDVLRALIPPPPPSEEK